MYKIVGTFSSKKNMGTWYSPASTRDATFIFSLVTATAGFHKLLKPSQILGFFTFQRGQRDDETFAQRWGDPYGTCKSSWLWYLGRSCCSRFHFCIASCVRRFLDRRCARAAVVSHGLCVLKITLSSNYQFELPDCVFNCATLEEIDLSAAKIREVIAPKSVCLPSLKKLRLDFVRFSDSSVVEKLNSGCPALEDLDLSRCSLGFSSRYRQTLWKFCPLPHAFTRRSMFLLLTLFPWG